MSTTGRTTKPPLWQQAMIGLAGSAAIRRHMEGSRWTSSLATRFVGGPDIDAAIRKAEELLAQGLLSTLYYLGEYVADEGLVEENVCQIITMIEKIDRADLGMYISVDPSQIGYTLSRELGEKNALRIAQALSEQPAIKFMMIDMEDYAYVQDTLALYDTLKSRGVPVAVVIQSYLRRSEDDIARLAEQGAIVRLVKGAFIGRREWAWTKKQDIDANYLRCSERLLSAQARAKGIYPLFATHDDRLIDAIKPLLQANGWDPTSYEFEMLYGVRRTLQRQLIEEGHRLRLYLPYGTAWWPYTARRIGENPANARFVLQALWGR